ncbi:FtsX-like permease family protein [Pedococcus cremeus]|uniref:FtsX-like permease family protein n=1 Tax=Pedococcus cremeus TaxID=587636 RepID=A0A1H9UEE7_9MICO|nr:FtsX-like permease family protein [Pedococcus cremeus]SES07544.1 FtsX-like permease family protein [Pedococcus cremeus]
MWAAIRYRRAQALVLVLLSAMVATCAVVAPLYQRALQQGQLRQAVSQADVVDTALVVRAGRSQSNPDFRSGDLARSVPASLTGLYGRGVGQMSQPLDVVPRKGLKSSPLTLLARDRVCEHVRVTAGRCPTAPGEVMVSTKDLKAWSWPLGTTFTTAIPGSDSAGPVKLATLKVSGAYEVEPDPAYWMTEQLDGKSGTFITVGQEIVPAVDDFVTAESTFTTDWREAQATLTLPLKRALFTLDNLDRISAVLAHPGNASGGVAGALVSTQLPTVIEGLRVGQSRLGVIVPLLIAQLALLAVAILLLVAQAAVEQRRPEVALARLRGRSREGAGRLVMGELALTAALGMPVGFLLAVLVTSVVRWTVLPPGVPFEVPWQAYAAVGLAAVACAGAIWLAARPVQRLTVSSLLRRVAPERSRAIGVVDLLAVALAAFGIVGLATRTLDGPLALLTPTLIALAAGLVVARLVVPAAAAAGRGFQRRGRIGPALAAYGLERRPGPRKVVTVVSVAVALTVFAANAVAVGDRNWQARAEVRSGAPLSLETDSRNPAALLTAVRRFDADGTRATPVAVVRRVDPGSTATLAVVSRSLADVAYEPAGQRYRVAALAPPQVPTVALKGSRVTGRISWDLTAPESDVVTLPPGQSGKPRPPAEVEPPGEPSELRLSVTTPGGQRLTRVIASVPLRGRGSAVLDAPLLCPDGCRLDGLEFRKTDPVASQVSGTVTLTGLGVDGRSLDVGSPRQWNAFVPTTAGAPDRLDAKQGTAHDSLVLDLVSTGFSLALTHADVPAVVPGLLAGAVPPGGTPASFDAAGLNGAPIRVSSAQHVDALPVLGAKGVLVDYETLARLGGTLADTGSLSVWLRDPGDVAAVSKALAQSGIGVTNSRSYAQAKEQLDQSASAQGLRLAVFTGAMGILLAALVVIVMTVTGWRTVARDLAALHMSGLRLSVLRGALVREQVVLVLLGSAVGLVCGAVSSVLAMPLVPLFDDTADPVPALQLAPAVGAAAGAALLAALVLVVVGWLCARGAGRRVSLQRVRESL